MLEDSHAPAGWVMMPAQDLTPISDGVHDEDAAALIVAGLTSIEIVEQVHAIEPALREGGNHPVNDAR